MLHRQRPLNCDSDRCWGICGRRPPRPAAHGSSLFPTTNYTGGFVLKKLAVLLAVLALPMMAFAGSVNVNFTDAGFTTVTTQYLATDGVSFSNALELTTGDGDIGPGTDYPLPPNGSNVITNDPADPLAMNITSQGALAGNYVYSLSGYYTSPIGITITAFNSVGGVLATLVLGANDGVATLFTLSIPGCTGASFSAACAIASITFSDGGAPDTLTLGELTLSDAPTPEPGTLALFGSGLVGLVGFLRRKLVVKKATPALLAVLMFVCIFNRASSASQITQSVDEKSRVTLPGNTRPEAIKSNDRGRVPDSFPIEHLMMQLKRSPEQEQALVRFIDELHDAKSPNFHKWLTAEQFGARYGVSSADIASITDWMESHGLKVNVIYPSHMVIDFSGTAGQIHEAFQTEIHNLMVKGTARYANMSDPRIPAALEPAVVGVVSMHNFPPHSMGKPRLDKYTTGNSDFPYVLVPDDMSTIYNFRPLFKAGLTGVGQTIVLIEDTDVFNPPTAGNPCSGDWGVFRCSFGLSKYPATFSEVNPAPPVGSNNCTDPGTNGDEGEAAIDVEYSSAAAPSANIVNAACAGGATFGGLIALQNLLNGVNPPKIVSISYGECEAQNGAASNATFNAAYQQGVTEGSSIFVSAGDEGPASCDNDAATATHGISATGWGETPYNVAVGGTDFYDTALGQNLNYWNTYNDVFYGSAKSYIPEIPWNDSCAGGIFETFLGLPQFGATSDCNTVAADRLAVGGSGAPSQCATGAASTSRTVSGTCGGYAKPSWQSVFGNPSDGVRDIPDVSLFASNGFWGHYWVVCWSDPGPNGGSANGAAPCVGQPVNWAGFGGTSVSSPIMAGIQALVNQKTGQAWGNPNPTLYALAAAEYGASGNPSCNSNNGASVGAGCVFYDVTSGDITVNCTGNNCYVNGGTQGISSAALESLTSITLSAKGSGYATAPTCTLTGGGGAGGTCTATTTSTVAALTLTAAGTGYNATPTCALSGGGGTGATCTIKADPIATLALTAGGTGYTSTPTCAIAGGGGTGATCTARRSGSAISSVTLSAAGSGYSGTPTCTISGGGGTGATCSATPSTATTALTLSAAGTGYTSAPTCTITAGGGSGATCTATADALGTVTLTATGGYQWLPVCTLSGGGGTGGTCTVAASSSASSPTPEAYSSTVGWDFSTGIGTVNAFNLVMNWP
jgi:Pro-kumamolisin, activation domain/PEP-CTERM motif